MQIVAMYIRKSTAISRKQHGRMILNLPGRWNGHRKRLLPKERRIEVKISEI